jgi:hypothetical protein
MMDSSYRTLRPGRVVLLEFRPSEPDPAAGARGNQPVLSWAIYLGEVFSEEGPRGRFGLPDGTEIDDRQVLWHFIPLGPTDHPDAQAIFLRRLRLRTIGLRRAHPTWFRSTHRLPRGHLEE